MIASLGMYDRAETAAANDALWQAIAADLQAQGIAAPARLTRGAGAYWQAWQSADLLLSQTCGLPFRARLHRQVTLVGTPDYGLPGCAPGHYRSVLIARQDDPRDTAAAFATARFACNEALSQSGWAAAWQHFRAFELSLRPALMTGSHRASAVAVAEGQADFAAIDAVTWRLLTRHEGFTAGLRVWGETESSPGLPLITAQPALAGVLAAAVSRAIAGLSAPLRDTLGLQGLIQIPAQAYLALPVPPEPAQKDSTA